MALGLAKVSGMLTSTISVWSLTDFGAGPPSLRQLTHVIGVFLVISALLSRLRPTLLPISLSLVFESGVWSPLSVAGNK